jgi:hypothetical protein
MIELKNVKVIGSRDAINKLAINTTSSCKGAGRKFSPFVLGPVKLYDGAIVRKALNMENAWQFSKVYKCHIDDHGNPTKDYFNWAKEGWLSSRAIRYPMGKGVIPEYSLWAGEKLDYISARKRIYFPLYAKAVMKTSEFHILKNAYLEGKQIILWDYDGYDYLSMNMSLKDVINNPDKTMGHAFVLAALIQDEFKRI